MFSSLALLALPLAACAQTVTTHRVVVGGTAGLVYTPNSITAATGDTILFEFHAKNHTATQTSFAAPCTPNGGVNSNFQPVDATLTANFPTYSVVVNNTDPLWFSCQQTGHCQMGMVFAVNAPTSGNTFDAFLTAAKASSATPPANGPAVVTVTQTVTLESSTYTTTYESTAAASATPNAEPAVHVVTVGGPSGLVYTPNRIDAKVGDTVQFQFMSKNHTATQSTFDAPCRKTEFTTSNVGFDSGFIPATDAAPVSWNVTVKDTAPVWVYCRQATHCGAGMVFAINSVETGANTFAAFQSKAKALNGTSASGTATGAKPTTTSSAASLTISASAGLGALAIALAYFL